MLVEINNEFNLHQQYVNIFDFDDCLYWIAEVMGDEFKKTVEEFIGDISVTELQDRLNDANEHIEELEDKLYDTKVALSRLQVKL